MPCKPRSLTPPCRLTGLGKVMMMTMVMVMMMMMMMIMMMMMMMVMVVWTHNIVSCSAYKDKIVTQQRCLGMQSPCWLDITTSRHLPQITDHTASRRKPKECSRVITRLLRGPSVEPVPRRAKQVRVGPSNKIEHKAPNPKSLKP